MTVVINIFYQALSEKETIKHQAPRKGKMESILRHLAIILDGIGEAAQDSGMTRPAATAEALERAGRIAIQAFSDLPDLAVLSLFSIELQEWMYHHLWGPEIYPAWEDGLRLLDRAAASLGASLIFLGRVEELSEPLKRSVSTLPPSPPPRRQINWFVNYSGRDEITRAAGKFLEASPGKVLTEKEFPDYLDTAGQPDPDLIIFAGGILEPKDFLLWQASYSEIWHTTKSWLEFSAEDLRQAIACFFHRDRRFGKL